MPRQPDETVTGTESPTRAVSAATVPGSEGPGPRSGSGGDGDLLPSGRCGRYEVLRQVGAGGMGVVFEARDPALDRKVALKLLRPHRRISPTDSAERLAIEARAMARLSHPNVITVFEIDWVDQHVYVAMELVAGTTLRGWLRERPRRWREIVEMFLAAGRGLAAAHAAGLVHRDFKPDNVLIGADGRPRVTDFGLVLGSAAPDEEELREAAAFDSNATLRGGAVGTPAYMPAEQWTGGPVDARSDQFAFCVALWEALCDSRPFAGSRSREIRAAVLTGEIRDPPRGAAPRWLIAMLRRGLAHDPAARWRDLTALLDALERRTRRDRRWAIAGIAGGIAAGSAIIAAALFASRSPPDPCAPPTERLAAVWNPARGVVMRARLVAADPALGADRFARIAPALGDAAGRWSTMHVEACRATRVEGRQSDSLLDRRMECLDRWLGELGATVAVISRAATPAEVDQALRAATGLSSLDACADLRALDAAPPPASPADRAAAIAIADQIRAIDVAQRAERIDGLAPRAAELLAAARKLDHAPTLVAALTMQVRLLGALNQRTAAEPFLHELVDVAARVHNDRIEAWAWMELIEILGYARGKTQDALALVPSARAAVLRAGDTPSLRSDLLSSQSLVYTYGSRPAEATPLLAQARDILEAAGARAPGSPLAARLASVISRSAANYQYAGDLDAAGTAARAAIEQWRVAYGPDSAREAFGWYTLASVLSRADKLDEALDAAGHAVRLREARLGESAALALTLVLQASIVDKLGRWDQSIAIYDRAIRIGRATASGDLALSSMLLNRGVALIHLDRLDDALHDFDETIAIAHKAGVENADLATAITDRGDVLSRRDRCEEAVANYSRAAAVFEKLSGPTTFELLYTFTGQAGCLLRLGRPAAAIPVLERALRCKAAPGDAAEVALARATLGRALFESGRDRAGGLAMARAARPEVAKSADTADDLRALDRWLAAHPR